MGVSPGDYGGRVQMGLSCRSFQRLPDYWAENTPEREAIFDGCRRMSYHELTEESRQLAAALTKAHIAKGDKVFVVLPNWHEFITLFFAIAKVGAILVPCNSILTENEKRERLASSQAKAVFVAGKADLAWLHTDKYSCAVFTVRFSEKGYLSLADLIKLGKDCCNGEVKIDPCEDVFAIMFTSGTTGHPKGVELTFNNLLQAAVNIGDRLNCAAEDAFLVPVPCSHLFGIVTGILIPLFFGGKIVLMTKHDSREALSLIEQEKITVLYGVPTMFVRELQEYRQYKKDISSLRTGIVAGAICSEELVKQLYTEFHCNIMVAYGSTETVSVSMTSSDDDITLRSNTVGKAFAGIKVKVVDDQGQPVKAGEVGELVVTGYGVMKGYYNMPDKTKEAFDAAGWLLTGDLATIDAAGYIKIVGRKKEMIIRGGYNIYPAEVEEIYRHNPEVIDVCVQGISHDTLGEQTCAWIQLLDNSAETAATLREYAKDKIAKYKVPDKVILVDELPRLDNGKINKKAL